MSAESMSSAIDEAQKAKKSANNAAEHGERSFSEAMSAAERTLAEATKAAEKAFKEGVEALRSQSKVYRENASEQFDEAQRYLVERVKERPMTAALAGVGVGLLLGLLLSSRGK